MVYQIMFIHTTANIFITVDFPSSYTSFPEKQALYRQTNEITHLYLIKFCTVLMMVY
jgi:hypothetical protein